MSSTCHTLNQLYDNAILVLLITEILFQNLFHEKCKLSLYTDTTRNGFFCGLFSLVMVDIVESSSSEVYISYKRINLFRNFTY